MGVQVQVFVYRHFHANCHVHNSNKKLEVKSFITFILQSRRVTAQIVCNQHSHHTIPWHRVGVTDVELPTA